MRRCNSEKRFLRTVFFGMLLLFALHAEAQRVVFSDQIDTTGRIPSFGPNRRYFVHALIQTGFLAGPQEYGMQTRWTSGGVMLGFRSKFRLWSWDAIVIDLGYRYDRFSMNQKTVKELPLDPIPHDRQKLKVHNLTFAICDRINFGKRGNVLGNWLDLGVYGDWAFRTVNVFVDRYYDSNSQSGYYYNQRVRLAHLPYMSDMNYGFTARVGGNVFGFFANYRINELIVDAPGKDYPDLPKLMIGVELYSWGQ